MYLRQMQSASRQAPNATSATPDPAEYHFQRECEAIASDQDTRPRHQTKTPDAVAKSTSTGNGGNRGDLPDHHDSPPIPHKYNDPNLPPMEFLLAVMHDDRVPMAARIDAAKAVSVYMHPRLAQISQEISGGVKIIIEGGLPQLPGTSIIMPDGKAGVSGQLTVQKTNGSGGREE